MLTALKSISNVSIRLYVFSQELFIVMFQNLFSFSGQLLKVWRLRILESHGLAFTVWCKQEHYFQFISIGVTNGLFLTGRTSRIMSLKIAIQGNKDEKIFHEKQTSAPAHKHAVCGCTIAAAPKYCTTASGSLLLRQSAAPKSIGAFLCTKTLRQNVNYLTVCAEDLPKIDTQIHPGSLVCFLSNKTNGQCVCIQIRFQLFSVQRT